MKVYVVMDARSISFEFWVFKTIESAKVFIAETFRNHNDYAIEEHEVIE